EALAHLGDHEAAGGPLQQAHAEPVLQLRHPLAEPRLGHAQRPSRRGEAAVLDHGGEEIQVIEILQGAIQLQHERFLSRTTSSSFAGLSPDCSKYTLIASPDTPAPIRKPP